MRAELYLETTVPSYLVGWPSRDLLVAAHQRITHDWWESRRSNFELYVSELVVQEARAGDALLASQRLDILRDVPILPVSSEILELAEDLITQGPIPRKAAGDAAHIAIATVYGAEFVHAGRTDGRRAMKWKVISPNLFYSFPDRPLIAVY